MKVVFVVACIGICSLSALAQGPGVDAKVVFTGQTTLIRIMDPSEKIAINGHVMRVVDLMPLPSSDSASAQHLRTQENHSREVSLPAPPQVPGDQRTHSASNSAASHEGAVTATVDPNPVTKSQPK